LHLLFFFLISSLCLQPAMNRLLVVVLGLAVAVLAGKLFGGLTGRPKTMCPRQMFLDPWSSKFIVPETQCPWIDSPGIICMIQYIYVIKMTGMYQSRDIVLQGTINLGTRVPRTFVRGHIVLGRPVNPPIIPVQ